MFTFIAAMALAAQPVETLDQKCAALGGLAESVMKARQSEVPMSAMMAKMAEILPASVLPTVKDMIRAAYSKPSYYSPEAKADEVVRFRNEWEVACYNAAG